MRPRFGGRWRRHLPRSTPWIVANHKNEAVLFAWLLGAEHRFLVTRADTTIFVYEGSKDDSSPPFGNHINKIPAFLSRESGRIEARTGLRMMPTFPRSSLSFRTAGFPQYGWKAGFPSGAFPDNQSA